MAFGKLLTHLGGNHFVGQIALVSEEHDDNLAVSVVVYLLVPALQGQE